MPVMTSALQDALAKTLTGVPASWSGLYLALHTADPGSGGSSEVTGGSYVRQLWGPVYSGGGSVTNTSDIAFPAMPAATVSHISVKTAQTGGTVLFYGPLSSPVAVTAGQSFRVPAGTGTFQLPA